MLSGLLDGGRRVLRRSGVLRTLFFGALMAGAIAARRAPLPPGTIPLRVILVANDVRDSMNMVFLHSTSGWRKKHADVNPANFGRGTPIWRETMRCLHGRISTDTLWITSWESPRGERAFAAAVTGECDDSDDAVGSWHTHPWRADSMQKPMKTRGLSVGDLRAFRSSADRISLAQWDRDSISGAIRSFNGSVQYPVPVLVQLRASLDSGVDQSDSAAKR
ncbi:MAG: hypothetical protein M3Y30_11495 [Gemmatimonadota bacterium]|nr:hypothetical protein [Gemmatimonadota bacterium]